MAVSAARLMSLVVDAMKSPPQAKADPVKGALVKAVVTPAPPTGSSARAGSTPMLPAALPLAQAMRSQQDGSAAVLRAYGFAGAAGSEGAATEEPLPGRAGAASDVSPRTDVSPPASRVAEPPMPNRPASFPLHGFAVLPLVGQADALAVKSGQRAVQKRSAPGARTGATAAEQKMPYVQITAAAAVAALIFLALIFAV